MKKFGTDWASVLVIVSFPHWCTIGCVVLGHLSGPLSLSLLASVLLPVNIKKLLKCSLKSTGFGIRRSGYNKPSDTH